ncbi:MAG: hypothetical protein JWO53_1116, partial [Chlamydiia bacterium]|nr:hypothetical protein [Chlamydiia bacterium]
MTLLFSPIGTAQESLVLVNQAEETYKKDEVSTAGQKHSKIEAITMEVARSILDKRNPEALFVTKEGKLTEHVIQLLKLDNLYDEKDSLAAVVDKTQKSWVGVVQGKDNKERTDLKDSENQKNMREKVEAIARK